jgi:hypothetical protein
MMIDNRDDYINFYKKTIMPLFDQVKGFIEEIKKHLG